MREAVINNIIRFLGPFSPLPSFVSGALTLFLSKILSVLIVTSLSLPDSYEFPLILCFGTFVGFYCCYLEKD